MADPVTQTTIAIDNDADDHDDVPLISANSIQDELNRIIELHANMKSYPIKIEYVSGKLPLREA